MKYISLRKLFSNTFEGHEGRPGKVGGSKKKTDVGMDKGLSERKRESRKRQSEFTRLAASVPPQADRAKKVSEVFGRIGDYSVDDLPDKLIYKVVVPRSKSETVASMMKEIPDSDYSVFEEGEKFTYKVEVRKSKK